MTRWPLCLFLLFLFPAFMLPLRAVAAEPSAKEIAAWIEQLGSAKFAERESASRKLAALDDVPDALENAIDSANPEIARRAKAAVRNIRERNFERLLQKDLAVINAAGFDLFLERMQHQPGYATDSRWRSLERVIDGMTARAGKLGNVGYRKPFDDCTTMPVHAELSPLGEGGSRLLLEGLNTRYSKMSRCVVACAGSFSRVNTIDHCVLLVNGDIDGSSSLSESFVLCTGRIGRVMRIQNCIVLSNGDFTGGISARNTFFQVRSVDRQSSASGNTYINLKSVSGASESDNKFVETGEGPLSMIKFFDLERLGLRVKLVDGETRVESIAEDSLLGRAGLQKGDSLLSLGEQKLDSSERLKDLLLRALGREKEITFNIRRGERTMDLNVKTLAGEDKK
jgi:PDZ domain